MKSKLSNINDNKTFWKTMKSPLTDDSSQSSRITLVEKDMITSNFHQLAKTFDIFFKNSLGNLNIKDIIVRRWITIVPRLYWYLQNIGYKVIPKNVSSVNPFNFSDLTETSLEKEIWKVIQK